MWYLRLSVDGHGVFIPVIFPLKTEKRVRKKVICFKFTGVNMGVNIYVVPINSIAIFEKMHHFNIIEMHHYNN